MYGHNITQAVGVDVAIDPAAAGTTDLNGKTIDLLGYESAVFVVSFGTITSGAVTSIKLQVGNDSGASDMADVAGSSVTVADSASNKGVLSAELHRSNKRYARVVVDRGTQNAVVNGGFVLLARSGVQPPPIGANMANAAVPTVIVSA